MTRHKPYDDLDIIGNPNHTEKIVVTELIDHTSKLYTFPDMMSKLKFLQMLKSSSISKSVLIKDISLSSN